MLPAELFLRWKRAFQVVLPILLALDMVHSMYYVAGLYQQRLEEWKQEDFAETSSEVIVVMHHVLHHCQHKDMLLWPKSVTAAFESATARRPHLAKAVMPIRQLVTGNQASTAPTMSLNRAPADSGTYDVFAQLGICEGDKPALEMTYSPDLKPACDTHQQQGHQNDKYESPTSVYMKRLWSALPEWRLSSMTFSHLPAWLESETPQTSNKATVDSAPAATPSHRTTSSSLMPPSMTSRLEQYCSRPLHWIEHSVRTRVDSLPEHAQLIGCPWPCMNVARRSALRWQIDWHGLVWPLRQQAALELQLDSYY